MIYLYILSTKRKWLKLLQHKMVSGKPNKIRIVCFWSIFKSDTDILVLNESDPFVLVDKVETWYRSKDSIIKNATRKIKIKICFNFCINKQIKLLKLSIFLELKIVFYKL